MTTGSCIASTLWLAEYHLTNMSCYVLLSRREHDRYTWSGATSAVRYPFHLMGLWSGQEISCDGEEMVWNT